MTEAIPNFLIHISHIVCLLKIRRRRQPGINRYGLILVFSVMIGPIQQIDIGHILPTTSYLKKLAICVPYIR